MTELLKVLSIGGDVGIWLLLLITWRFHERIIRIEFNLKGHIDLDEAEFKRINHRLEVIEDKS